MTDAKSPAERLNPKITVVTPSFNQGDYIEKTIDSVLSQNYPNLEYIVIDGGSTDQSVDVIRKYEKHLTYWVSEKDRGQSHAINKGMARATGEILTWLNSDDWYMAGALKCFANQFLGHPDAGLVVGRGCVVDLAGRVISDRTPSSEINFESICSWLGGGDFVQPSSAFSRSAWEAAEGLNEDIHIALDVDLWLRMTKAGYKVISTNTFLSTALSHPKAKTTAFVDEMRFDCARVIASHGSMLGYEQWIRMLLRSGKRLEEKAGWYERNYRIVLSNPLLRFLQPIVKRVSREGRYWQARIPAWFD